jgi:hypothetical protein
VTVTFDQTRSALGMGRAIVVLELGVERRGRGCTGWKCCCGEDAERKEREKEKTSHVASPSNVASPPVDETTPARLTPFPAFIVTADAASGLEASDLSGFRLRDVEIGTSETFDEVGANRELPEFRRLEVTAKARDADFGLDDDNVLVISDAALDVLRQGRLEHADIEEA